MTTPELNPVYPRVYGGTSSRILRLCIRAASIPACTGEPVVKLLRVRRLEVYPRVYGGTISLVFPRGRS